MPFQIIRNDITKVKADAIVNTANPKPIYAEGTDAAIYKAAGEDELLAERRKIGNIAQGEIAVTPAFKLQAKYIIHTVGPIWIDGEHNEFDILRNCYRNSLNKAKELGCESIAFPLISTGVYGFPKDEALKIATDEIGGFLMREDTDMQVNLVVFDEGAFKLSKKLFFEIISYIDDDSVIEKYISEYRIDEKQFIEGMIHESYGFGEVNNTNDLSEHYKELYQKESLRFRNIRRRNHSSRRPYFENAGPEYQEKFKPEDYMHDSKDDFSFRDKLLSILIKKNIDNNDAYKRSNIDRRAFAKILSGETKIPKKSTVFAFCIGLDLTMKESEELLSSAGMAFTPSNKWDQLVIHFIGTKNKDFAEINSIMIACHHPQLGLSFDD